MLLHSKTIATACVLSLTLGLAAPAQALGKKERNVLMGIAAVAVVGAIINNDRKSKAEAAPQRHPHRAPAYQPHKPQYTPPKAHIPRHKTGRVIGNAAPYGSGLYDTAAARVFNNYSYRERVKIQRRLARAGFYNSTIDGSFGPGTYQAVYQYARRSGNQNALGSVVGARQIYRALLG
ncbi:peptidoglycan-binding domain-containing protein [Pseudorhodobacter aquimaris]|uniref:peptidoglycan-binding domain-containing protein n=1 Tax=Pseudorhodobacter aquimaris TaxID=687412 RepID=UPI00067B4F8F|nr:peptidoglycan-binding domain-containing protein [Pseudorhodobacter aquimaris]